jgi:MFS transporter, UMF1 family
VSDVVDGAAGEEGARGSDGSGFPPVGVDTREQRGWYVYDWANSAYPTTVITVFLGPYLTTVAAAAADDAGRVHLGPIPVAAGSLFLYAVSLSVVLQVVVLPVVGAIADRAERKTPHLALYAFLGAGATMGFFLVTPGAWVLGSVLLLVSNVAFGASVVVYDSFLPEIAAPSDRDRVSSRGWALGYIGGGLLLALNLGVYLFDDALGIDTEVAVRASLASAGVWWAVFTLVPLRRLRERGGLRRPQAGGLVGGAFRELGTTFRGLRRYPLTLRFLVAFLLYNDGVATVLAASAIFAAEELLLGQDVIIGAVLLVQFVAFGGALGLGHLARRIGAKRTVLGALVVWSGVVAAARLLPQEAVVPFLLLATLIGVVMGGTQALSRSLFSQLVPAKREAEYFGLYQIADRGTSWIGTFVLGVAVQVTGSYRSGLLVLLAFFVSGGLLLAATDLRRGIDDVGNPQPDVV